MEDCPKCPFMNTNAANVAEPKKSSRSFRTNPLPVVITAPAGFTNSCPTPVSILKGPAGMLPTMPENPAPLPPTDQQRIKPINRQIPAPPERTHNQNHPTNNARNGPIKRKSASTALRCAPGFLNCRSSKLRH